MIKLMQGREMFVWVITLVKHRTINGLDWSRVDLLSLLAKQYTSEDGSMNLPFPVVVILSSIMIVQSIKQGVSLYSFALAFADEVSARYSNGKCPTAVVRNIAKI